MGVQSGDRPLARARPPRASRRALPPPRARLAPRRLPARSELLSANDLYKFRLSGLESLLVSLTLF